MKFEKLKSLNIGGKDFKIIYKKNKDETIGATIDFSKAIITIDPDCKSETFEALMMHEMIHGVFNFFGKDPSESVVTAFSNVLLNSLNQIVK